MFFLFACIHSVPALRKAIHLLHVCCGLHSVDRAGNGIAQHTIFFGAFKITIMTVNVAYQRFLWEPTSIEK